MKRKFPRRARLVCAILAVLLLCGLTACVGAQDPPVQEVTPEALPIEPAPPSPVEENELFPADVKTVYEGNRRQIIKTYTLADGEKPADIPRDSFTSDGWLFELSDVTKSETGGTNARPHVETVDLETETNNLDEILEQLAATLEYESEDGYSGVLTLDVASVQCEAAGYENSNYTVTVTREYEDLPANDLYYIPKTVTENGRTLALDSVDWQAQSSVNVGYSDIPDTYRAVAKYAGRATMSVATGYVTTADYTGEITKEIEGETVYTAYFTGTDAAPTSQESEQDSEQQPATPPAPDAEPDADSDTSPIAPLILVGVVVALLAGAAAFLFLRHNVKVYSVSEEGSRVLAAKVRISAKNPVADLTPLDGRSESRCFVLEIDKLAAKGLNGYKVDVIFGSAKLSHKIAYEGNIYTIEANFHDMAVKAIY